ncbi:uncharacterized protein F4807DRAFT_88545 [Annulohypoxylon truncatum]|uniref:uncharacterized protein n=1 Tax=Annulohypoxylon truncatum TaxID=327061 RepID=UPI002007EE84|nr:uncharacterized protein F4807DRAFT_88545 [Annulohypoxylon truncatum]KAI1209736.1 hypothetical protein F4807DRAFT_88545 [Annulohypoxylon truncatum]
MLMLCTSPALYSIIFCLTVYLQSYFPKSQGYLHSCLPRTRRADCDTNKNTQQSNVAALSVRVSLMETILAGNM